MKKVTMLEDKKWSINYKSVELKKDQSYDLEDNIANSIINSGFGSECGITSKPMAPVKETLVQENKVIEPEENKSVETEAPKKSRRGRKKKSD